MKLLLIFLLLFVSCNPTNTNPPVPSPSPSPFVSILPVSTPKMTGFTLDDVSHLPEIVSALKQLKFKPVVRLVFDENVPAKEYVAAVVAIHPYAKIMGELLDSFFVKECNQSCYESRAKDYITTLPLVDIWECANEINGDPGPDDWLGKDAWKKASAALRFAKAAGKLTAVTFYLTPKQDMFRWIDANVSAEERKLVDYALISYYQKDNDNWLPPWKNVFDKLGTAFPSSLLGIGECGDDRSEKLARAEFKNYYVNLKVEHPRFIGGYFWWYTAQVVGKNPFLLPDFVALTP